MVIIGFSKPECPKKMRMIYEQNTDLCEGCCVTVFIDNPSVPLLRSVFRPEANTPQEARHGYSSV